MEGKRVDKFWFSPELPKEVLDSCEKLLIDNSYIIPSWCESVSVSWNAQDAENVAYITTHYEYRTAHLVLCPYYLNEDDGERDIKIKHELSHILTAPMVSQFRRISASLLDGKDDATKEIVEEVIREKFECVTEDLARLLVRAEEQFNSKKKV